METQSGWREAFAPATGIREFWGDHPMAARLPSRVRDLIEMLDESLEAEQAPTVDQRLARVVRIIVEQYDGDVKAFVESIRYRVEAETASDHGDEAVLRKCLPKLSRAS